MAATKNPRAGGLALAAKRGVAGMVELGRRGGRMTVERHGSGYMAEIGHKGGEAWVMTYLWDPMFRNPWTRTATRDETNWTRADEPRTDDDLPF